MRMQLLEILGSTLFDHKVLVQLGSWLSFERI
jgi:hypothetical protein